MKYSLFSLPSFLVLVFLFIACPECVRAQTGNDAVAVGYITALHPPDGFEVNGQRVILASDAAFGPQNAEQAHSKGPWRERVQVGAYVWVWGSMNHRAKTTEAHLVLLRNDWDRKLTGVAVIDRVISAGPTPVFQADGYHISITRETTIAFAGDLKSLDDVGTNNWISYEGKRDSDGRVIATKATFIPAKPTKVKTIPILEQSNMDFRPPDVGAAGNSPAYGDGSVKLRALGKRHPVPGDTELQARVHRIGMSLVPQYQKELAAGRPSKIDFRFYAVDAKQRGGVTNSFDGLVLVPTEVLHRIKCDDQLAAVLADGVAYQLQRQAARTVADNRKLLGAEVAEHLAAAMIPGVGLITWIPTARASSQINTAMEEQRGRVALSLMADAGFDPWQAPEAWRLLASKKLPKSTDALKYPDRSGYQLSILNLQYRPAPVAATR